MAAVSTIQHHLRRTQNDTCSKPIRRQYQSCDQCRRGRRACDASALGLSGSNRADHATQQTPLASNSTMGSCTNCSKIGKKCTFNWLRSLPVDTLPRRTAKTVSGSRATKRQKTMPHWELSPFDTVDSEKFPLSFAPSFTQPFTYHDSRLCNNALSLPSQSFQPVADWMIQQPHVARALDHSEFSNSAEDRYGLQANFATESMFDEFLFRDNLSLGSGPPMALSSHPNSLPEYFSNLEELVNPTTCDFSILQDSLEDRGLAKSKDPCTVSPRSRHGLLAQNSTAGRRNSGGLLSNPSSDTTSHRMAESTNKIIIVDSLMRIYHDSFENALSSWLSEQTCPYNIEVSSSVNINAMNPILDEWGSSWSNRICISVCQLDAAFSRFKTREVSALENRASSQALNTAIMAFASQWNPNRFIEATKRPHAEYLQSTSNPAEVNRDYRSDSSSSIFPMKFDQSLQRSLWHKAQKTLRESVGLDSFRVIFAQLIFSLTQRPLEDSECNRILKSCSRISDGRTSINSVSSTLDTLGLDPTPSTSALTEIAEMEGPPIYLETALRHLFSWRRKIERSNRSRTIFVGGDGVDGVASGSHLGVIHRKSFNMLFWLGVMCDTTSAAINQRPLVISDEDSAILAEEQALSPQYGRSGFHPELSQSGSLWSSPDLWGDYLLNKSECLGIHTPRWPCSYQDAATTLCEATPVKVLLYRLVARLQTLSYRRAPAEKLEECIQDALLVCQRWNSVYGQFMIDCVANHDILPPRIQSWLVILVCHWHLAGLLLAETIDTIDEDEKRDSIQRGRRQSPSLALELRKQNAFAIAAVAHASCAISDTSFSNAQEFHFAVNKASLLTEPWTDILIRSLSKAANTFLYLLQSHGSMAAMSMQGYSVEGRDTEINTLKVNTMACIQALRVLAKKSDMANLVAQILSNEMDEHLSTWPLSSSSEGISGTDDIHTDSRSAFVQELCDLFSLDDETHPSLAAQPGQYYHHLSFPDQAGYGSGALLA